MHSTGIPNSTKWTKKKVEKQKAEMFTALSVPFGSLKERLRHILSQFNSLESSDSLASNTQLELFLLAVSAIVHVGRHGGLTVKQCEELFETGQGILRIQKFLHDDPMLGYLHSDLCTALSAVYRREGAHWRSSWMYWLGAESQLRPDLPEAVAHDHMIRGQRLMRLNHVREARQEMALALEANSEMLPDPRAVCRILIGRCMRLQCEREEALIWFVDCESSCPPHLKAELDWEISILKAVKSQDFSAVIELAASEEYKAKAEYVVEAKVWAMNTPNQRLLKKAKSMKQTHRDFGPTTKKMGAFFLAAQTLEHCYDSGIPIEIRKRQLCEALEGRSQFGSIEKELLVLGAAARFLHQEKSASLLELVLLEYRAIALQMTGSREVDPIGLIEDVLSNRR